MNDHLHVFLTFAFAVVMLGIVFVVDYFFGF